jgi:hypothetical protein
LDDGFDEDYYKEMVKNFRLRIKAFEAKHANQEETHA